MEWLNKIERKMGRHYIPDLMKYICLAMLGVFILDYLPLNQSASALLAFNRARIFQGEIWRIITFIFLPPESSIIWILKELWKPIPGYRISLERSIIWEMMEA